MTTEEDPEVNPDAVRGASDLDRGGIDAAKPEFRGKNPLGHGIGAWCGSCNTPVPEYLFAINRHTGSFIWVNGHAIAIPCTGCGADVRTTARRIDPAAE